MNLNLLVADSSYQNRNYYLTPLANPRTQAENLYNEFLIRTRNTVERTYGVWERRFPILASGIELHISKVQCAIDATAVLYNMALDQNERDPPELKRDIEEAIIQNETVRKAIYTQKIIGNGPTPNFFNPKIGIEKVKNDFFAFHVERAIGYKIIADIFEESEKCRLREIAYTTELADPWISVRKNSSYKELMKAAFRKLHETGIQNREFRKIYYNKKPVCESRSSSVTSVGLTECYYAFLIFLIGCLVSTCLLISEIATSKWLLRQNIRK